VIDQAEQPVLPDTTVKQDKPKAASAPGISSKLIESVAVELEAFLGAAEMTVAELTALSPGAVVALDAPLSAAVELRLNGVVVARGELVAVGEQFGVRLSEIVQWPD
jgi:flagellar motor switch protein FliN